MSRKCKKYEKIILEVLTEIASSNVNDSVQDIVISDTKKHHYQILHTGWFTPEQFVYQIIIHFQIMESGKVWLLANNTDNPITEELVRRGIPPSEIVLGFQPPLFRSISGYAVN